MRKLYRTDSRARIRNDKQNGKREQEMYKVKKEGGRGRGREVFLIQTFSYSRIKVERKMYKKRNKTKRRQERGGGRGEGKKESTVCF
jgi:hypothetical protein